MADARNNNPKYFILDYTHEELMNILERVADYEGVSEERVLELINAAQFGDADFSGYAKITYVDEKIADIELLEGPAGPQGPVGPMGPQGEAFTFEMFTPEQLEMFIGPKGDKGDIGPQGPAGLNGIFDSTTIFEELLTSEKTIVGAINELFTLLKSNTPDGPEQSELANVYYGYFPYTVNQDLINYADIKLEYLQHKDAVIQKANGILNKTSIGNVPEACFIVVAIKKDLNLVAKKDDGIGGLVDFDEATVCGANNLEVDFDGEKYLLFGEYTIIAGERFIYVTKK